MRRTLRTSSFLVIAFVLFSVPSYSQRTENVVSENVAKKAAKASDGERNFLMLVGKLKEETSIDFFDTPLEDVVEELSDRHGVTFVLDRKALEEIALEATEPVTKTLSGVTLHTALSLLLDDHELVLSARGNVLIITTDEAQRMMTRVYETEGLVHHSDSNWDHLIEAITISLLPESWEELGGQGTISVYQGNLVVSQSFEAHLKLVALLNTLKRNIANRGGPQPLKANPRDGQRGDGGIGEDSPRYLPSRGGGFGGGESRNGDLGNGKAANKKSAHHSGGGFFQINTTEKSKRSRRRSSRGRQDSAEQDPISEQDPFAVGSETAPRESSQTPPVIKHSQKTPNVIDLDQHVTLNLDSEPLDKALRMIGKDCGIDFQIDKRALEELALVPSEPVSISVKNLPLQTSLGLMLKDLELTFTPRDGYVAITTEELALGELYTKLYDVRRLLKAKEDEPRLIKILTGTVDPDTWEELGGAGTMYSYYGVLLVSATHEVHTKTTKMIEMLTQVLESNPE